MSYLQTLLQQVPRLEFMDFLDILIVAFLIY